ncbi:hypothetical protein D3C78_1092150 [compost metagenome]
MVNGHGSGEIDHSSLGCTVGSGTVPAFKAPAGAGINDAATASALHHRDHIFGEQIDSLKRYIHHQIPVGFLKLDNGLAADNPRIIEQNIDFAVRVLNL